MGAVQLGKHYHVQHARLSHARPEPKYRSTTILHVYVSSRGGLDGLGGIFFLFFLFFDSTILPGNIVVEAGFVQTERHSDEDVLYEDRLCWTRREGPLAQNNRSSFIQKEFNRLLNQNHPSIALWNLLWALGNAKRPLAKLFTQSWNRTL